MGAHLHRASGGNLTPSARFGNEPDRNGTPVRSAEPNSSTVRKPSRGQWRKALLVLHITSSVALLGEVWGLVILNLAATVTNDLRVAAAAYELMGYLVFGGGIPLSLSGLATGVTLAVTSRWGLTRYYWVLIKLILLICVILIGMLLFTPAESAATVVAGTMTGARQWEQVAVLATQAVSSRRDDAVGIQATRADTSALLAARTHVRRAAPGHSAFRFVQIGPGRPGLQRSRRRPVGIGVGAVDGQYMERVVRSECIGFCDE